LAAAEEPLSVWLDSSLRIGDRGRYSLFGRRPACDISLDRNILTVRRPGQPSQTISGGSSLEVLDRMLSEPGRVSVGYVSYEASLPFVELSAPVADVTVVPIRFLQYDSVIRYDHDSGALNVTNPSADDYDDVIRQGLEFAEMDPPGPPELQPTLARRDYLDRVRRIKEHIHEGDIYQANFTSRIDARSAAKPTEVYRRLRQVSPAPYSAYMNFGNYQVLSSSPERMFSRRGDYITTGPIKGTIARGSTPTEEAINRRTLLASEKDRAELLMIVDLERNDLGRIARAGSVMVESLFRAETYSSVIHLVSDIGARLNPGTTYADIFRALLPGGSITGAPKRRAMEIIRDLEETPRSIYTGAIGYIEGDRADFNIAIRTMIHRNGVYHIHAGGGIVADSNPEAEYDEMMLKAGGMLKALGASEEQLRW